MAYTKSGKKKAELFTLFLITMLLWASCLFGKFSSAIDVEPPVGAWALASFFSLWLVSELRTRFLIKDGDSMEEFVFGRPNKSLMSFFVLLFIAAPLVGSFAVMMHSVMTR